MTDARIPVLERDAFTRDSRSPGHVVANSACLCNVSQTDVDAVRGRSVYPEDNSVMPLGHRRGRMVTDVWGKWLSEFAGVNEDPRRSSAMTATSTSPIGLDNAPTN